MHFREVDLETFAAKTQGEVIHVSRVSRTVKRSFIGLDLKSSGDFCTYINPTMMVAKLPNVVLKGAHSIPFSLEKSIYVARRLTHHDRNPLWGVDAWTRKTADGVDADLGDVELHITEPAFLCSPGTAINFGHFIWEVLARALMLSRVPDHANLKILYPNTLPLRFLFWLESMGIKKDRLIPIPTDVAVLVDTLYVSTAPFNRTALLELVVHEESLRYMRSIMLGGAPPCVRRERLFFSRSGAATRRCVNELDVYLELEPHGVRFLTGVDTPPHVQLDYVRSAELIIAPLGAASAIAAFAPDDCMVVELQPPTKIFGMYNATVSALVLGQPFKRLMGQRIILPTNDQLRPINWDYEIDLAEIRKVLKVFLSQYTYY